VFLEVPVAIFIKNKFASFHCTTATCFGLHSPS